VPTFLHPDLSIGPVPGGEGPTAEALVIDIRPATPTDSATSAVRIGRLELALEIKEPRRPRGSERRIPYGKGS
jgi:hypothetical protein